jgi:hypothetical protein
MPSTHPATTPPAQPAAQVHVLNTPDIAPKEQRAWSFESSYLDIWNLEEYLDGLPNLTYRLEVNRLFGYPAVLGAAFLLLKFP